ncbi:MAG: ABC transporter permease [Clostridia bacterium]|nr:ABC transporter permease [Clostridia bacterium]
MGNIWEIIFATDFIFSVVRVTTPILLAALGAIVSDRAGVVNIGLEGIMLMAAITGVVISAQTQSAFIGLFAAVCAGILIALILGYFVLEMKSNIILGGIAVNLFASGGSVFLLYVLTGEKGTSSSLASKVVPNINIPIIKDIPIIGEIISGHNLITYIAILSVVAVYLMLNKTPMGTKIRSVGENYHAAESVGINVKKVRYIALGLSGMFAGFGGAFLSMGYVSWFSRDMSAGRGWIALAAEAMGGGNTIGTTITALIFGFAQAFANSLQGLNIPSELITIIPNVVTVLGLCIFAITKTTKVRKVKANEKNNN